MPRFMTRRWLLASLAALVSAASVQAQPYPSRPIRMILGFGAGGGADIVARLYAAKLQELLGQSVVVENRVGAGQIVAFQAVKSAAPDGYTLLFATGSALFQAPGVRKSVPYDSIKDYTPIAFVARAPGVFYVSTKLPVNNMAELVRHAKANPGKINYASAGIGAANHLQIEQLMTATGIKMTHIPYKSDAEVSQQVGAGLDVHLAVSTPPLPLALVASGKARILAVTGGQRLPGLPAVPSLGESGMDELKGIDAYSSYGILAPAGLPADLVAKLNEAVNKVSQMPEMQERMRNSLFLEPAAWPPEEFRRYIVRELAVWREIGKAVQVD